MVAAEVGEARRREPHAADPAQHQRVAGDLHDDGARAGLGHGGEQRVQAGASGVVRALGIAVTLRRAPIRVCTVPIRPVPRPAAQAGLDQVGRRRLAVGAGDADDRVRRWLAVDAVGQGAEHGPRVVDDAHRQAGGGASARPAGLVRTATAPAAAAWATKADAVRAARAGRRTRSPGRTSVEARVTPRDLGVRAADRATGAPRGR